MSSAKLAAAGASKQHLRKASLGSPRRRHHHHHHHHHQGGAAPSTASRGNRAVHIDIAAAREREEDSGEGSALVWGISRSQPRIDLVG